MLGVLFHHAKSGDARISPAAGAAKNVEFFVCLSVYLSVCHACERQRFCAPFCHEGAGGSTFSHCCQLATSQNAEVQKTSKFVFFRRQRATE